MIINEKRKRKRHSIEKNGNLSCLIRRKLQSFTNKIVFNWLHVEDKSDLTKKKHQQSRISKNIKNEAEHGDSM